MYFWNAETGAIVLGPEATNQGDYVCSVSWITEGSIVAVGYSTGSIQVRPFAKGYNFAREECLLLGKFQGGIEGPSGTFRILFTVARVK